MALPTGRAFYIVYPEMGRAEATVVAFRDWALNEIIAM